MNKKLHCGEGEIFLYEDTDGYGICDKTNEVCRFRGKVILVIPIPISMLRFL